MAQNGKLKLAVAGGSLLLGSVVAYSTEPESCNLDILMSANFICMAEGHGAPVTRCEVYPGYEVYFQCADGTDLVEPLS